MYVYEIYINYTYIHTYRRGTQVCKLELPPSPAGGFENTELKEINHISSEEYDTNEALNISKCSISAVKGDWPAGVP